MRANPITIAHDFAAEVHKNEFRRTGEPYIVHPESVARIVRDFITNSETVFRPVLPVIEQIEALLHDVMEARRDQKEERLERLMTRAEEERVIRQVKQEIADAFVKAGYKLHGEVADGITVRGIIYDIDSLTDRHYWRTDQENKLKTAGLLSRDPEEAKYQIKAAAYAYGHERLIRRSEYIGRMTAVKVKYADTTDNGGDNAQPARAAIYNVMGPHLKEVLTHWNEANHETTRSGIRHPDNVVVISKSFKSKRPVESAYVPEVIGPKQAYG